MIRRPARLLLILGGVLLVVLVGGRAVVGLYTEVLWFRSLGQASTFWTRFGVNALVRTIAAAIGGGVVLANLWLVARNLGPVRVRRRYGNIEIAEQIPRAYVLGGAVLVSALAGWWLAAVEFGGGAALTVAAWARSMPFGVADPLFGHDLSFYVFTLPVLGRALDFLLLVALWSAALVALGHVLVGGVRWDRNRLELSAPARLHLLVLMAVMVVLLGMRVWLGRYELMIDGTGIGGGLGYTDVHARLPAYWAILVLSLAAAAALVLGHVRNSVVPPVVGLGALLLGGALLAYGAPAFVQKFQVEPNELAREARYIGWNIDFTRAGYGLDALERQRLPYRRRATVPDGLVNDLVTRLALWDPEPLRAAYNQLQALFDYYRFLDVDFDRYGPDGDQRQVAISVREFHLAGLAESARTWQTTRLNPKYVRGQGAVVTPAAAATSQGEPDFWLANMEPVERTAAAPPSLQLDSPSVYFGESSVGYAILIPGRDGAFLGEPGRDYPAGIRLDSFLRVLAFAWEFGDKNLLFSGDVTADSRFVFRRVPRQRVAQLAPFLLWDPDPYPVIARGRIVWMLDGYAVSGSFPLSAAISVPGLGGGVHYLRSAVKATVDALTGETVLYAVRDDEPVLETFRRIFPDLVRPLARMPPELRRHVRYPPLLLEAQSRVLQRYHLDRPEAFYAEQDVWQIPDEIAPEGGLREYRPTFALVPLPGASEPEYLLMMPFLARGRQNMTAVLVARNDEPALGELILYELPRDQQIPGPTQIQSLMEQDPVISSQLSLWRRAGSDVDLGHLRVIPLDSGFVYVEPLFLSAQGRPIPELARVVLSDGSRIAMAPTLREAFTALGAGPEQRAERVQPARAPQLGVWPTRALRLLEEAEERLRSGDWAGYGARMNALRELLEGLTEEG